MPKRLKADFSVNINNVLSRAKKYPLISKVIEPQLNKLTKYKQPPFVEQVHEVVYWLHRYSDTSKRLLNDLESKLVILDKTSITNREEFFVKFRTADGIPGFNSAYSELCLADFFLNNGIKILEIYPTTNQGKTKADFKIALGNSYTNVELVTPGYPSDDFELSKDYLFKRLERVLSGFVFEVEGFELFDRSKERVTPPTKTQIDEMIANFRKFGADIKDDELPKKMPTLCNSYPRIEFTVREKNPNYKGTFVSVSSSRTASGFPVKRIVNTILEEKKHFSPDDVNFVFVDFGYWSQIDRWFLDAPNYADSLKKALRSNMSSRIHGVFTYLSYPDNPFVNRRILCLNPRITESQSQELKQFLNFWETGTIA